MVDEQSCPGMGKALVRPSIARLPPSCRLGRAQFGARPFRLCPGTLLSHDPRQASTKVRQRMRTHTAVYNNRKVWATLYAVERYEQTSATIHELETCLRAKYLILCRLNYSGAGVTNKKTSHIQENKYICLDKRRRKFGERFPADPPFEMHLTGIMSFISN